MRYERLIEILLAKFPQLSDIYEEDKYYLENLPHLVFENIFVPYIIDLYEKGEKENLIKAIDFINEMVVSKNERIREVVIASILEALLSERKLLESISPYFNKELSEFLRILENTYGYS